MRARGALRGGTAPLLSAVTYTRWVYLVLGGVLFVPFLVAVLVVVSLLDPGRYMGIQNGAPAPFPLLEAALAAGVAAATVRVPGVLAAQFQTARSLLGGPLADEPTGTPPTHRARPAVWMGLHFLGGFGVALATMIGLTEAAMLALLPVNPTSGTLLLGPETTARGLWPWFGPVAGALVTGALVYLVALLGAGVARVAPAFFGPSAADRLAAAQARADDLAERNRLAAELHDSIGHALSVVALQAGTAARLLDQDPEFARTALTAIADQARDAGADLDHVLGALREHRPAASPQRTLADLPSLVEAAHTAGARVRLDLNGSTDHVPAAVSREAYRLCQEAVTNALRHTAHSPDGPVTVNVELSVERSRLALLVTNPVTSRPFGRPGGGSGLRGMAERVRVLGGELDAGERDGTWRLSATIPWEETR